MAGFEDLDNAASDQSDDAESNDKSTDIDSGEATGESKTETETETGVSAEEIRGVEQTDPRKNPAFPYSEAEQFPFYARQSARDKFESARQYETQRLLDQECGLSNIEKRELYDAALRLVGDHPELWAEYVLEGRGLDVPDDLGDD